MGELSENAFFRTFLCPFLCFSPSRYELFLEKNVAKIKMIEKRISRMLLGCKFLNEFWSDYGNIFQLEFYQIKIVSQYF